MKHLGTCRLETDRLILRRFAVEDGEAMYRNWASDPEVVKFLTWIRHTSPEVSLNTLAEWVRAYEKADYYLWAIVPKTIGEPVGSISVVGYDNCVHQPEVGYCIGRPWWRQGFTSEALGRIIDFLIEEVGADRIESRHDPRNPGSGVVMRKCGMSYEGTLRQADRNNQGICDACVYAILAEDWRARKQVERSVAQCTREKGGLQEQA